MPNSYTTLDLLSGSSGLNAVNQLEFGPFAFEYINTDDIKFAVKVSGEWKAVSVASVNTTTKRVTLSATPQAAHSAADTDEARIYRSTTLNAVVDFQAGSRISEADLDNAYRQGLFAAQEATEDAPGSASRTVQATDDIADSAITAAKLATDAVETAKIKDAQVTAAKLASTLDLSSKTLTIPAATVTEALVTQHNAAIKTSLDISSGMNGTLPVTNGGTGLTSSAGQVLEQFLLPCDGIAYTARSGSVTPTAVNGGVVLADAYADVAGSVITYTPPSGTKLIVYKYVFSMFSYKSAYCFFKVVLGGVDVDDSRHSLGTHDNNDQDFGRRTIEWPFVIGGVANAATGRKAAYSDWSSGVEIRIQARRESNTHDASLHGTMRHDAAVTNVFNRPLIGITAIG